MAWAWIWRLGVLLTEQQIPQGTKRVGARVGRALGDWGRLSLCCPTCGLSCRAQEWQLRGGYTGVLDSLSAWSVTLNIQTHSMGSIYALDRCPQVWGAGSMIQSRIRGGWSLLKLVTFHLFLMLDIIHRHLSLTRPISSNLRHRKSLVTAQCQPCAWSGTWSSLSFPAKKQLLRFLLHCSACTVPRLCQPARHTLGLKFVMKAPLLWNLQGQHAVLKTTTRRQRNPGIQVRQAKRRQNLGPGRPNWGQEGSQTLASPSSSTSSSAHRNAHSWSCRITWSLFTLFSRPGTVLYVLNIAKVSGL